MTFKQKEKYSFMLFILFSASLVGIYFTIMSINPNSFSKTINDFYILFCILSVLVVIFLGYIVFLQIYIIPKYMKKMTNQITMDIKAIYKDKVENNAGIIVCERLLGKKVYFNHQLDKYNLDFELWIIIALKVETRLMKEGYNAHAKIHLIHPDIEIEIEGEH